jgi:hydrogenase large subunit
MNKRVIIDPVTRIEGHLRIEAETDDGGTIRQAYSAGTMVRGLEIILRGRDPRDAWAYAQRICGVCTLVHGIASVRAVEDALKITIPANAQLIRNLMIAAQYVHDHVMHFYHLHALDWVDVVSALSADPRKTSELAQSISSYPKSSPGYFGDTQKRLKTFVDGGRLGIFGNGYWGHPAYKLPPEANLMAVAHYLEALAWQRDVARLHAIFGGKNPHPNFVVGGVPCAISVQPGHGRGQGHGPQYRGGGGGATALDIVGLETVRGVIGQMRDFVDQVYLPDLVAIAGFYKDWATQGEGLGNFLCYGEFPAAVPGGAALIPGGVILGRDLAKIHDVDPNAPDQVQEFVARSWYDYGAGKQQGLHPYQGETAFNYSGPKPPYQQLDVAASYSWLKSPRWRGHAMEVGPLARVLLLYARGHAQTVELANATLKKLDLPLTAMFSTLGRTAARGLETKIIADAMPAWFDQLLANIKAGDIGTFDDTRWEPSTWPGQARGVGLMEAPRGALGHRLVIEDGKIANYQAVVPSTWNAGPRDAAGQPGAYEAALVGTRLHDANQPIEILRTIHSFDPCIACAVHVVAPGQEDGITVKVV